MAAKVDALPKNQLVEAGVILDEASIPTNIGACLRKALLTSFRVSTISTLSTAEKQEYASRAGTQGEQDLALLSGIKALDLKSKAKKLAAVCGVDGRDAELLALALPYATRTECLVTWGGDDRLLVKVDDGKTNKYYTSPVPDPDLLLRSSCTASTVHADAFRNADEAREKLLYDTLAGKTAAFDDMMESIRDRLAQIYLPSPAANSGSVLLTPSGSDAEFAPTTLALSRARRLGGKVSKIEKLSVTVSC